MLPTVRVNTVEHKHKKMKKELRQAWINVLKIEPEKTVRLTARQANDIAEEYERLLCLPNVSESLLSKYMKHVILCEGSDFTRYLNQFEDDVRFSKAEISMLKHLSDCNAR